MHPEEALYLPTFSHLFDCQSTFLSLSLSLTLTYPFCLSLIHSLVPTPWQRPVTGRFLIRPLLTLRCLFRHDIRSLLAKFLTRQRSVTRRLLSLFCVFCLSLASLPLLPKPQTLNPKPLVFLLPRSLSYAPPSPSRPLTCGRYRSLPETNRC